MMMLRQTARTVSRCSPTQHSAALAPTGARRLASHGAQYNEPTGRLFGEQPPAPGTKRTKDDWENIYYWGMGSSLVLAIVLGFYGPRTSAVDSARKAAQEKQAAAGETPSYARS